MWWRTSCPDRGGERGFTLVEVMVAFTIMALMAGLAYSVLFGAVRRSRDLQDTLELRKTAQAALNLMVMDIKGAFLRDGELPVFQGQDRFHGGDPAHELDMVTATALSPDPSSPSGDLAEVGYRLSFDGDGGGVLARREEMPPSDDGTAGGSSVEVCSGVRSLQVRYFDGQGWLESWDSLAGGEGLLGALPQEVEVELVLVGAREDLTVRTRVAVPMAGGGS